LPGPDHKRTPSYKADELAINLPISCQSLPLSEQYGEKVVTP
jgi:hypothetical protein